MRRWLTNNGIRYKFYGEKCILRPHLDYRVKRSISTYPLNVIRNNSKIARMSVVAASMATASYMVYQQCIAEENKPSQVRQSSSPSSSESPTPSMAQVTSPNNAPYKLHDSNYHCTQKNKNRSYRLYVLDSLEEVRWQQHYH